MNQQPTTDLPILADDRALMTTEQLAAYLQAGIRTIYRYIKEGRIPVAAWVGNDPRFHRPSVLAALSTRSKTTEPTPVETQPTGILAQRRTFGRRTQGAQP